MGSNDTDCGMARCAPADKIRHPKRASMLAALSKTGNISASARAAEIHRSTHYEWLALDPDYAAGVDQALEEAVDVLEAAARKRALIGSDVLLIFLLKGHRPEKYRERHEIKHQARVTVEDDGDAFEVLRDPEMVKAIEAYHARRAIKRGQVPRNYSRLLPAPSD